MSAQVVRNMIIVYACLLDFSINVLSCLYLGERLNTILLALSMLRAILYEVSSILGVVLSFSAANEISATSFGPSAIPHTTKHNDDLLDSEAPDVKDRQVVKDAVNLPVHDDGSVTIENDAHGPSASKCGRTSFPKAPRPDDRQAIRPSSKW